MSIRLAGYTNINSHYFELDQDGSPFVGQSPLIVTNGEASTQLSVDGLGNTTLYNQQTSGATRFGNETGEFFFDNLVNGNPTSVQASVNLFVDDSGTHNLYTNSQTGVGLQTSMSNVTNLKNIRIQPLPTVATFGNPVPAVFIQASPIPQYRALTSGGSQEVDSSWAGKINIIQATGSGILTLDFDGLLNRPAGMKFDFIYSPASSNTSIRIDWQNNTVATIPKPSSPVASYFSIYYDGSAVYPLTPVTSFA
jgi:hypothetical protein